MRILRNVTASILLTISTLALLGGIAAIWLHKTINDTDGYVNLADRLIQHEPAQAVVAERLSDSLMDGIRELNLLDNLEAQLIENGMPAVVAHGLVQAGGQLEPRIQARINKQMLNLMNTEQFRSAWRAAHRSLHQSVMNYLNGRTDTVIGSKDGALVINLDLALEQVRLPDQLGQLLPPLQLTQTSYELADAEEMQTIREGYKRLNWAATWLPWIGAAGIILGFLLAPRRLLYGLIAVGVGAIVFLAVRHFNEQSPDLIYNTLTGLIG